MKSIKTIALSLSLVILSAMAFVGVAGAQTFKAGDTITVPANETVNSMLFAGGNNIDIAGTVNGDVYCAGQTITISGTVNGDVFCAGQTIVVSGKIDGDARLGGQSITLSNTITGSATIGAQTLIVDKNATISRDLLGGGQNVTINGVIGRDFVAGSQNLLVNGEISRNFKGSVTTLTVGTAGIIGGNVDLISNNDPIVNDGGKIVGTVKRTVPKKQSNEAAFSPFAFAIGWFIYSLITILIVALVLVGLFPRVLSEATEKAMKKPGITALIGVLSAILAPIIIAILFASIIGIPLAILMSLMFFVVIIISAPFAGYMLGRIILPKSKQPYWIMALGTGILVITYFIPFIGFITMLAGYLFGTGMVVHQGNVLLIRSGAKK